MTQLRVCDACSRHVFVTEKACPFCNAALGEAPQRTFGQRLRSGMSRAQLLAVAAAVSGQALGACSDTKQNDGRPNAGTTAGAMSGTDGAGEGGEGGEGGAGEGGAGGEGGAAGTMSGTGGAGAGGAGAGGMAGAGAGGLGGDIGQPVYGGPVDPEDAGVDAGDDAGDFAMPEYGASPVPED
jgi:hypothetical protein